MTDSILLEKVFYQNQTIFIIENEKCFKQTVHLVFSLYSSYATYWHGVLCLLLPGQFAQQLMFCLIAWYRYQEGKEKQSIHRNWKSKASLNILVSLIKNIEKERNPPPPSQHLCLSFVYVPWRLISVGIFHLYGHQIMPAFGISQGEIVINTMFYFFCCEVAALLSCSL